MKKHINEWKKWIAEDRILFGNKKDNFWEMGDTGPVDPVLKFMWIADRMMKEKKQMEKHW